MNLSALNVADRLCFVQSSVLSQVGDRLVHPLEQPQEGLLLHSLNLRIWEPRPFWKESNHHLNVHVLQIKPKW